MSRALLAGRMQPEGRSVCVFLPDREQLSLTVGVSGSQGGAGAGCVSSSCSSEACWCRSADPRAVSQLGVIGAPFVNWVVVKHLGELLKTSGVGGSLCSFCYYSF